MLWFPVLDYEKENDSFSLLQSEQEWPVHITHSEQYLLFRNYRRKKISQVGAERSSFDLFVMQ